MGLRKFEKELRRSEPSPVEERSYHGNWNTIDGALNGTHDELSALSLSSVFYCTSLIADSISTLPVDVFRRKEDGREAVEAPAWLKRPNPYTTSGEFWHRVMTSLLFRGNAYIMTIRNERREVTEVYNVNPDGVDIVLNGSTITYNVRGIAKPLDRSEMIHIAGYTLSGSIKGVSPLEVAEASITLGKTAEEFGAEFFENGIHMTGVIEHPGQAKEGEAERMAEQFGARHTSNRHAIGMLTGGATWKPITITPEQAQFLETRRFNRTDIALFYKVPAFKVDPTVQSTWGSGVAEQNRMFLQETLVPWIVRIEQAVNTWLLPGPQYMKFNVSALLRASLAERYQAYTKAWWMTGNEIRGLEDMEPLDGLDEPMVPLNLGAPNTNDAPEGMEGEDNAT